MTRPRSVKRLNADELSNLSTARLLAYRDRLLSLADVRALGDWEERQLKEVPVNHVAFKEDPEWVELYEILKRILRDREHVDR